MGYKSKLATALFATLALGGSLIAPSITAPCLAKADEVPPTENVAAAADSQEMPQEDNAETPEKSTETAGEAPSPENLEITEEPSAATKRGLQLENGTYRYYDEDGTLHKGWLKDNDNWYWFDENTGDMTMGWKSLGDSWYWFDPETGVMATSRTECDGSWSDFSSDGAWQGYASGWGQRNGSWVWFENDGLYAHGWRLINGAWYWMDDTGIMQIGWATVDGKRYHLSESGAMSTGWLLDDGSWYWLDPANGNVCTGWQRIGGRWYWADQQTGKCAQDIAIQINSVEYAFDNTCAMVHDGWGYVNGAWYWASDSGLLEDGWHNISGDWYWFDPESKAMSTGLITVADTKYFMSDSGAMTIGWGYDGTKNCWYYADPTGKLLTDWQYINGAWYWLDPSTAVMQTGWQKIEGKSYYFSDSGSRDSSCWIDEANGNSCYLNEDGIVTVTIADSVITMTDGSNPKEGLVQIGNTWFYVLDGKVQHGSVVIDGKEHLFDEATGRAITGWHVDENGIRRHYDSEGVVQTGWVLDGSWYYLDENGIALTGWQSNSNKDTYYYLNPETGAMETGWLNLDGAWYLLDDSTGAMKTGWAYEGSHWYFMDESGRMQTGWLNRGGNWYWLDAASGAMGTGWLNLDGAWYLLDDSTGAMKTGWAYEGSHWYFMDESGRMQTGWLNRGGNWYWLDAASGAMGTGWIWDGSDWYFCAADGRWISVNVQWYDMFNWAQDYSSSTNYLILVDTQNCRVGIYTGQHGAWSPAQEFICSPGAPSTPTVKGQFTVQDKGYVFGHGYSCYYYTQFYNDYLFHSVLYNEGTRVVQDGRLGQQLSHGCVRLAIDNAKWIYDNVPRGTKVVVW